MIRMEVLFSTLYQKIQVVVITVMIQEYTKKNSNLHKMDGTILDITLLLKLH